MTTYREINFAISITDHEICFHNSITYFLCASDIHDVKQSL